MPTQADSTVCSYHELEYVRRNLSLMRVILPMVSGAEALSHRYEMYFLEHSTVTYTESGTPMLIWDSRYLCHFSTEMAEIWSPGTSFQDLWTCKIAALYLLYF